VRVWRGGQVVALVVALAVAAGAVAIIWAEPRPNGDLDVALAVGRDVMDGKLGRPDDWAFTTAGRVCINQNWGSHLLHYLVYRAGGTTGLLLLKAALIGAAALFVCLAAWQRQVSWAVALVAAAGAIAAGRSYIDLRANLTTLVLAPLALWLLFKTRRNVHWIWAVMVLNGLWANMHGGFIFGLGMMALWVAVRCVAGTIASLQEHSPPAAGLRIAARRLWPLPAALAGSVLLAAFANPYGPVNLTFPLTIVAPAWQRLREWLPLLAGGSEFGTAWEFLVFLGVLGGLLFVHAAGIPGVPVSYPRRPSLEQLAQTVFDLALAAVGVGMTFRARRFAPLTIIVCAPLVAVQVQWLMGLLARAHRVLPALATIALAAALAVPLGLHVETLRRLYDPRNPNFPAESFFDRMHMRWVQPLGAAEFLAANHVTGRVFHEWEWEGYLHWKCPGLKLFVGGRAHQVYDPATDELATRILTDPRTHRVDPTAELVAVGVHLVTVPIDPRYAPLMWHLTERPQATWACVYCGPREVVAADLLAPETAELARRAIAGELTYPDAATAALSKAMAMQAPYLGFSARARLEAMLAAADIRPNFLAYRTLHVLALELPPEEHWNEADYFARQYARLAAMDPNQADGLRIAGMRVQVASYLADLYRDSGDRAQASRWAQVRDRAAGQVKALMAYWP
jgi:hypothetical protein